MSKNILFVYSDIIQKKTFEQCEFILGAALKRFRKRATFSYMQLDFSPLGFALSEKMLLSKIRSFDAVIWDCSQSHLENELNFAVKSLGVFGETRFCGGSFIFSPLASRRVLADSDTLSEEYCLPRENIKRTALLALSVAKRQKRALTLCCDFENTFYGKTLFREFENALATSGRIEIKELSHNEFLWNCAAAVPDFSILLTGEKEAQLAHLNLCALKRCPTGYIIWHADNLRLYRREALPYEQMNNYPLASILLSCAQATEAELGYENVGAHLKKCVSLALEKCGASPEQDSIKEVIFLINTRIRRKKEN